jgi:cytochrome b subunit of formate dehydrogenase
MIENSTDKKEEVYYQRFEPFLRFMHLIVIISFISLAFTGMIIKFSGVGVFQTVSSILGGYEVTGFIHRVAAFFTFLYLFAHIGFLTYNKKVKNRTMKYIFSGENSMVPSKRDAIEFWQTMKWFFRAGPRPQYGRWTYWEKFDYFAVFWGVIIIGLSGLILWFPEFFTSLGIPGPVINIATIIHSDEALLATGFIFTIHFFNTHFRPDKFPMDMVIFTGRVPLEEFKLDRPRQYKYLVETGQLEKHLVGPPSPAFVKAARIFGFTALTFGLFLVVLIIYSMIFIYR